MNLLSVAKPSSIQWVKVEGTWERSFTSNMARSEFSYQARRLHRQAELAFRESKELKSSMQYLGEKRERLGESQSSLSKEPDEHQRNGAEKFACSIIMTSCSGHMRRMSTRLSAFR